MIPRPSPVRVVGEFHDDHIAPVVPSETASTKRTPCGAPCARGRGLRSWARRDPAVTVRADEVPWFARLEHALHEVYPRTKDFVPPPRRGPGGPRRMPLAERFARSVERRPGGCLAMTVEPHSKVLSIRVDGEHVNPFRLAYAAAHGALAHDRIVGHRCANERCVNPEHLIAETWVEWAARTRQGEKRRAAPKPRFCDRGHPFVPRNTARNARGGRYCKTCFAASQSGSHRRRRNRLAHEQLLARLSAVGASGPLAWLRFTAEALRRLVDAGVVALGRRGFDAVAELVARRLRDGVVATENGCERIDANERITVRGVVVSLRRLAFAATGSRVRPGDAIEPNCGDALCVNPFHLEREARYVRQRRRRILGEAGGPTKADRCGRGHDLTIPGARTADGAACATCVGANERARAAAWRRYREELLAGARRRSLAGFAGVSA